MATPQLNIINAQFGGADFTSQVKQLITSDQEVVFNSNYNGWTSYGWNDPWPGNRKVMVIFYQWANRNPEMLVALENSGTFALNPNIPVNPSRLQYFNPFGSGGPGLQVVAVVWGSGKVGPSVFQAIAQTGEFTPSNSFMGLDPNYGMKKTAEVYYRNGSTADLCIAAQESGNNVQLV